MGRLLFFDLSNDTNLNLSVYEKPCFEHMFRFLIKYQCIANGKDRKIKFYLSKIDSKLHSPAPFGCGRQYYQPDRSAGLECNAVFYLLYGEQGSLVGADAKSGFGSGAINPRQRHWSGPDIAQRAPDGRTVRTPVVRAAVVAPGNA